MNQLLDIDPLNSAARVRLAQMYSVNGDNKREGDEVFYLDLSGNSVNSLFTKNRGIGTILNDD